VAHWVLYIRYIKVVRSTGLQSRNAAGAAAFCLMVVKYEGLTGQMPVARVLERAHLLVRCSVELGRSVLKRLQSVASPFHELHMRRSLLEEEIRRWAISTQASLAAHDRGVVLGFLLSLVPLFPVPLVGLALGFFHVRAHRVGKLSDLDYRLSRRGLLLAAVNTMLSVLLIVVVVHLVGDTNWTSAITYIPSRALEMLRQILHLAAPVPGRISV
jgi:hypothetical protein